MEPTASCGCCCCRSRRGTLYAAQARGALSDPWVLSSLPVVLGAPGRPRRRRRCGRGRRRPRRRPALRRSASSACRRSRRCCCTWSFAIGGAASSWRWSSSCSCRRCAMLPGLLSGSASDGRDASTSARKLRRRHAAVGHRATAAAYAVVPSELSARATRSAARASASRGGSVPLASARRRRRRRCTALGLADVQRPAGLARLASGGARPSELSAAGASGFPGLSRASAAVAQAQVRLALRTPRGRSILLSPLIVVPARSPSSCATGRARWTSA